MKKMHKLDLISESSRAVFVCSGLISLMSSNFCCQAETTEVNGVLFIHPKATKLKISKNTAVATCFFLKNISLDHFFRRE